MENSFPRSRNTGTPESRHPLDAVPPGMDGVTPRLSVVVVSVNRTPLLEACLQSLASQSVRDGVELLVVTPRDVVHEDIVGLRRRYPDVRWVHDPTRQSVPALRGLGIVHSRGEVVAFLEDDCVAEATWCAALLAAHREPLVAIGGAIEPGRYAHPLDWAVYLFEYGRFMRPLPAGPAHVLPGTNVSYKRDPVLAIWGNARRANAQAAGDGFFETFVNAAILRAGYQLKLDPAAFVYNINSWRLSEVLPAQFRYGRAYATIRGADEPLLRRLARLGVAVILPAVHVARIGREVIGRRRHLGSAALAFPWLFLLSCSWSVGEFLGCLRGLGGPRDGWRAERPRTPRRRAGNP